MTAKMTAAGRALESRRPDRLFDDPLAQALAGEDGFRWMEEMRPPGTPTENPSIGPRTWFFDELITRAAGDGLRGSCSPPAWTPGRSGCRCRPGP
jgi:O-methyltransferase involved in polyketide biosynthesis